MKIIREHTIRAGSSSSISIETRSRPEAGKFPMVEMESGSFKVALSWAQWRQFVKSIEELDLALKAQHSGNK